jgi:hypothetical protein
VRGTVLHGNVDEGQRRATQSFILAEDEGEVTTNLRVGDGNGREHAGLDVFGYMRLGDESDANIGCDKALEQFTGVELH